MKTLKSALAALPALLLAACAQNPAPQPQAVGMANPASVYCVKQGGKLLPKKDAAGGEYALCQLPDGRAVEEWALFRSQQPAAPAP
ncbi:Putative hemolysin [Chromobacterium vaccinii]|nr:Putative hemolysin [Chromobacterium vaccinii]QND88379.1 Putative hemolysin [Chromobacterium vaccinii]